ncbi:MAG: hypothetical protein R3249_05725 [Nitriliruptorales bacterium]|nr:hypothetical protein [Nitriliruptorales bacterium]
MVRGRLAVVLAALLVAGGCTGGDASNPALELARATETLFEGAWQWDLEVDADQVALEAQGDPNAAETVELLNALRIGGVVADGATSVTADWLDVQNIVELRFLGDSIYARADVAAIASFAGADPPDVTSLVELVEGWALDASFEEFVRAAVGGEWVGLTGLEALEEALGDDLGTLVPQATPSSDPSELERIFTDILGATPEDFLDRHTTVTEESGGAETVYTVTIQARTLVEEILELADELVGQQLGGLGMMGEGGMLPTDELDPAVIPVDIPIHVVVRDGLLHQVRIDVVEIAQTMDETAAGTFVVTLNFAPQPDPVTAPDDATVLDGDDLAAALEAAFMDFFNPFGDLPDEFEFFSEFPTDFATTA